MNVEDIINFRENLKQITIIQMIDSKIIEEITSLNKVLVDILSMIKSNKRPLSLGSN